MDVRRRIARNFLSLAFAQLIAGLLYFAALAYLARTLGPDDFGKMSFAEAALVYFTGGACLGLDLLGARELARHRESLTEYVGNIIALRSLLAILAFGLLMLFTIFLPVPPQTKRLTVIYGVTLFPLALSLDWVFQGVERMEYSGISLILRELAFASLAILLIKGHQQLFWVPGIYSLSRFVAVGFLLFEFVKRFGRIVPVLNPPFWKLLLRQALPMGLSQVMMMIVYNLGITMLGLMRSSEEAGYYNAAYKPLVLVFALASAYLAAIFPAISRYAKTSLGSLRRLTSDSARLALIVALPLIAVGTILAKPGMNLMYGNKFDAATTAFRILLWAAALGIINGVYARALLACDRQNAYLGIVVVQVFVTVVFNLILIPVLGLVGACLATLLAESIGFFGYYGLYRQTARALAKSSEVT